MTIEKTGGGGKGAQIDITHPTNHPGRENAHIVRRIAFEMQNPKASL